MRVFNIIGKLFILFSSLSMNVFGNSNAMWMENMYDTIKDYKLFELTIPGTHDSAAYDFPTGEVACESDFITNIQKVASFLHISLVSNIIKEWSKAQSMSFYDQFVGGIRYIDFRLGLDPVDKQFRTHHGLYGNTLDLLLEDIYRFKTEYPHEILILQFGGFCGTNSNDEAEILNIIENKIGHHLYSRTDVLPTVRQMMESNKTVLATAATNIDKNILFWNPSIFLGSYANTVDYNYLIQYLNQNLEENAGIPDKLYSLSWTFTPNDDTIKKALLLPWFYPIHSLYDLSSSITPSLGDFISNNSRYKFNIIVTDFFEITSVVEWSKRENLRQCNDKLSGVYCRNQLSSSQCSNSTISNLCPLTCGTCQPSKLKLYNEQCQNNIECQSGNCMLYPVNNIKYCGSDELFSLNYPCGHSLVCSSGYCDQNHKCSVYPSIKHIYFK